MRAGKVSLWITRFSSSFEVTYTAGFPTHLKSPWYHLGWRCWYQPLGRQPNHTRVSAWKLKCTWQQLTSPLLSDICLSTLWSPKIALTGGVSACYSRPVLLGDSYLSSAHQEHCDGCRWPISLAVCINVSAIDILLWHGLAHPGSMNEGWPRASSRHPTSHLGSRIWQGHRRLGYIISQPVRQILDGCY